MDLSNLRIMNAAGWCKDVDTVRKLARTPVSEITVGSITRDPRQGNEGNVFWQSPDGVYALNSLGLPNPGLEAYRILLIQMQGIALVSKKHLRISIAGFSPDEYAVLARGVLPFVDTLEINLGCPNVWGMTGQKPIASFDPALMWDIFDRVRKVHDEENLHPRIAVKFSPYSEPAMLDRVVELVKAHGDFIDEIVTSNTFPNAFGWDGEKPAITPGGGFAGMSGKAMKGIALGQAARFRAELDPADFVVTAVGGITSGTDILDFARIGVTSVQVGTHYFVHGEKVFSELLQECAELVD